MSRWFRLYNEVLDDPKVQRLSGDDFKVWVNLLCLASRHDGALPPTQDIGFSLRLDDKKARAVLSRLVSAGLLDQTEDRYAPHGWNDRQYQSDVSTSRVKQHRQRKKAASGNVDETFHETAPDTDTDTEQNSVTNVTAQTAEKPDPNKLFWDNTKAYLGKSKSSMVGKWVSEFGRERVAAAVSEAQVTRAVDPVPYINRVLRGGGRAGNDDGFSIGGVRMSSPC